MVLHSGAEPRIIFAANLHYKFNDQIFRLKFRHTQMKFLTKKKLVLTILISISKFFGTPSELKLKHSDGYRLFISMTSVEFGKIIELISKLILPVQFIPDKFGEIKSFAS